MKNFLAKNREKILLIIPVIITVLVVMSAAEDNYLRSVQQDYMIDVETINNGSLAFVANTVTNDAALAKKTKDEVTTQMQQFNDKYKKATPNYVQAEKNSSMYSFLVLILSLLQILLVLFIPERRAFEPINP